MVQIPSRQRQDHPSECEPEPRPSDFGEQEKRQCHPDAHQRQDPLEKQAPIDAISMPNDDVTHQSNDFLEPDELGP
jgi:hypothetical protein